MKFLSKIKNYLPSLKSSLLAVASAILLILAFPGFEFWFLAWFALIPLFVAIEWEKESIIKSALVGWLFGTIFYFGSCWWLTFAPITYAKVPTLLAYFLLLCATLVVGSYSAIFGGVFSLFIKRFGHWGTFSAPFLWTAIEFLRLWTSGNNWNSIGYSQAFNGFAIHASYGGVFFVGFWVVTASCYWAWFLSFLRNEPGVDLKRLYPQNWLKIIKSLRWKGIEEDKKMELKLLIPSIIIGFLLSIWFTLSSSTLTLNNSSQPNYFAKNASSYVIAIQPNVPMSGLNREKWTQLRQRQINSAEKSLAELKQKPDTKSQTPITVILPESPMNFQYDEDPGFRIYINGFANRNNVSVLFNSAEPDRRREFGYFNSAVLINEKGEKVSQYDKMYLLPFGEFVPLPEPIEWIVPTMVGRFSPGEEYDLLPFGEAKAGVMICFESHFPSLAREFVRNGADVLVEMTNDGYLGDTPVLRQHLASAVFRAVETNRPVLRVTNVGITAYINQRGEVLDEAPVYAEATKIWSVSKSDGKQTIYVKYGEWFAWLCSLVSIGLLVLCLLKKKKIVVAKDSEKV